MKLLLASIGNPDYGQDPYQKFFLAEDDKTIEVSTLKEASKECMKFIGDNELGRGNWSGGQVYENDKLIADISYNGRAWTPGPGLKEIKF